MNSKEPRKEESRLALESAKLNQDDERSLADLGLTTDLSTEPEY